MATLLIGPTDGFTQKFYIAWIGTTTLINSTNFTWYTFDKVAGIYGLSPNRQSYISSKPGGPLPAVTQFVKAAPGALPNIYELDLKAQISLDDTQVFVIAPASTAPTISSFSPTQGAAGSTVVITGTNFTNVTLVSINSAAVQSFVANSATQITAVLTNAQVTGKIRVTTTAGTAVSVDDFVVPLSQGNNSNAPALTSLTVESNNTKRLLATFNKAIQAPIPVAGDFALSDTHMVIGELPTGGSGFIQASGYDAPTATGTTLSSGTSTTVFNKEGRGRIWQNGRITTIKFYCPAFAAGAQVAFLLGQGGISVDITALLTFGQLNTITLPTPIPVTADTVTGLSVTGDTASLGWIAVPASGSSNGGCVYGGSAGTATTASATYVPIVSFLEQGPLLGVMGDSQLAGFPDNVTYCMPGYGKGANMAKYVGDALGCATQDMSWSLQRTDEMLARFNVDVVLKKPKYVVIGGGYNNSGDPPGAISDISAMGNMAIAAGITPIFIGSLPARKATGSNTQMEDTNISGLLKQINDGVKAYATSVNAKYLNFAELLGDVSPSGIWYVYKDQYWYDGIHPNQAGYTAEGVMLLAYLRSITPVTLVGSRLELQVNRAFTLSDQPSLTLGFVGTQRNILSTDGGILHNFAAQPITLNLPQEPEILNFVSTGVTVQYRADKAIAPNTAGYLAIDSARDTGSSFGIDKDITTLDTFKGDTPDFAEVGLFFANGGAFWLHRDTGYNQLNNPIKPYYRIDWNATGLYRLLESTDNANFTPTGYQFQFDPTKRRYFFAKYAQPTQVKALGVSAY